MNAVGPQMSAPRAAVAVLARSPRAVGKTRLTAGYAEAEAQALRLALCLDAIEAALSPGWPVHVFLDPADDAEWLRAQLAGDAALAPAVSRIAIAPQAAAADLGVRMTDALARTLATGAEAVVLIGSDAPDLPAHVFHEAAEAALAATAPVVLGPASDGGFYLVAARAADGRVFDDVVWSRDSVCAEVTARAHAVGREVRLVRPWSDVDTPDDLSRLLARGGPGAPRTRAIASRRPPYNRA